MAISAVAILAITAVVLASTGASVHGVHVVVRTTAQTSLVLFSAAFVASSLHRLVRVPATRWLLANRRYVGVSFAVSHLVHLIGIIALVAIEPGFERDASAIIGGGLAYVFLAAMTATSFDRSAAWLGPRAWRRLHTIGGYYLWTIFFVSYLPRALHAPAYVPPVLLLLAVMGLRIGTRLRR